MKSHASSSSSFSCVFERLDRVKNFPIISILPLHFNKLLSLGAGCCCWWLVVLLLRGRRRCDGGVWLVPYLFVPSLPLALVCGISFFFLFVVSGISNIETHQCCSDLRRHYNNNHTLHLHNSLQRQCLAADDRPTPSADSSWKNVEYSWDDIFGSFTSPISLCCVPSVKLKDKF